MVRRLGKKRPKCEASDSRKAPGNCCGWRTSDGRRSLAPGDRHGGPDQGEGKAKGEAKGYGVAEGDGIAEREAVCSVVVSGGSSFQR
jgi:hypothetical protein